MRLWKSEIVANLRYLSLQIPDISINERLQAVSSRPNQEEFTQPCDPHFGIGPVDEVLEIPEDWVIRIDNGRVRVGTERGFAWLSPLGYINLRPLLYETFRRLEQFGEGPWSPRGTWEQFVAKTNIFFTGLQTKTQRAAITTERKAAALRAAADLLSAQLIRAGELGEL